MKKLLLVVVLALGATGAMAQSKIAHMNSQKVLDTMPERLDAIQKYQEFELAGFEELKEMDADLKKAYEEYEKNLPNMSPVIQKIEQDKIIKKQQALEDRQTSFQQELQVYSQELNQPIFDKVQSAVEAVADRLKLDYVLDVSSTVIARGQDITDDIIQEVLK